MLAMEDHDRLVNEEYKIWKKNAPYLYDVVVTNALEWPSLTVEWLPDVEYPEGKGVVVQRLVIGTHTAGGEQNYLQIASVTLPADSMQPDTGEEGTEGEQGGFGGAECRIAITNKIAHEGEINRARYMPQNPCLIATKTVNGSVHVFDYTKHPSKPEDLSVRPDIVLNGHTREGYGLSWNKLKQGYLLSCGEDRQICLWDVCAANKDNRTLEPLRVFTEKHSSVIEDVAWNGFHGDVFGSVGDDKTLVIWDLRADGGGVSGILGDAHAAEINCLAFSPHQDGMLITGSADKTIRLWDSRNLSKCVHSFDMHGDDVLQVAWNPEQAPVFASAGADRRVNVWDVSRIGMEQNEEDVQDGPPELLFVHGGHTNKVSDLSWNANDAWTLCSVSEDNILQIWKMSSEIYEDDEESEELDEDTDAADEPLLKQSRTDEH